MQSITLLSSISIERPVDFSCTFLTTPVWFGIFPSKIHREPLTCEPF